MPLFGPSSTTIIASAAGQSDSKYSVRLASVAALDAVTAAAQTLTADAAGVLTVDGVATVLNDRILVKNQVATANNGLFYVSREGTAGVAFILTRADDANAWAELPGAVVSVEAGTLAGTQWQCTVAAGGTLGTTSITFAQAGGAATATVAGVVELATSAEAVTGSDTARAVTPAGLLAALAAFVAPDTARTATADGTTTGTIAAGTKHVTVTCDDVNKIIILPSPVTGDRITLFGASAYELRTSTPSGVSINGGIGANVESAIPANTTVYMTCVSSSKWIGFQQSSSGVLAAVEVAAV